jgi:LysR family transcriptional regulator, low CO2-responsive transcriptional regulator
MLHLTLRQLRIFESVSRHLSFSRAADELHLTQPAVSMQVKQLEDSVGLPLFEQIGKKIFLTEAGQEMYHHCRIIGQQLRDAEDALMMLKGVSSGKLSIALLSTAKYFAPALLAGFCKRYPGVQLKLAVSNRETLLRELADNAFDIAIMGRPPDGLPTVAEPFAKNPHVVVAPADHPLARSRRIPLERLARETFLLREQGSGTRYLLERLFAEKELPLNAGMEMSSNETIKQAVMAGMGISLLSVYTVLMELKLGRLVVLNVAGLPIVREWCVVHREKKRLSPVALAFKDFMTHDGAELLKRELQGQSRETLGRALV